MNVRALAFVLAATWAFFTLSVNSLLTADPTVPCYEYAPNMVRGPDQDADEPCSVFADGRTARAPVPGAIARGHLPFAYEPDDAGRKRAGLELASPIAAADDRGRARGAVVFDAFCSVCHGDTGAGDGLVTTRGVPPPPALSADQARALADGEIFHIITLGRKNMPALAAQVSVIDRWRAIAHVRTLQEQSR